MEPTDVKLVPPGEGKSVGVAGGIYTIKASGEDTEGRYAVIEMLIPPGSGPMPHTHSREAEAFFLMEGELSVQVGERRLLATAGAFLLAPAGIRHSFKNESASPARALLLVAPAGLEKFFLEVGHPLQTKATSPVPVSPQDIDKIRAAVPRYGISIDLPKEGS